LTGVFRESSRPVIHIQHQDDSDDFKHASHGWRILPDISTEITDHYVSKTCCDAFIGTDLSKILKKCNATMLFIVGCATDFRVDSTIKGAISHGFDIVIPSDGHTTSDRPHFRAKTLIDHFNWNWGNLITGEVQVTVTDTLSSAKLNNPSQWTQKKPLAI